MKTQDRTIRDIIFDKFYNNFSEQDLILLNEIAEFAQQLKQPEKQEIEIAGEHYYLIEKLNEVIEAVNKLKEK